MMVKIRCKITLSGANLFGSDPGTGLFVPQFERESGFFGEWSSEVSTVKET